MTDVPIHVLQGERTMASDNKSLGRFTLSGIPLAPRGVPQIEVTFDIDANGIVNVSAKDLGTGKTQQVTITGGTALSQEEIDEMVKAAEAHANEDETRREQVEARNQADHAAYSVEKQLKEHADKLTDDERAGIEDKVTELRKLLTEESTPEDLRKGTEELFTAAQVLGQKIYEASQTPAEGTAAPDGGGDDADDVVEAEIVDDDENDEE
jgi:molecular chaperone DnaK